MNNHLGFWSWSALRVGFSPIMSPVGWRTVWLLTGGQTWTGSLPGSRWWSWCCCWGGRGTWRRGPSLTATPAPCRGGRRGHSEQPGGTCTEKCSVLVSLSLYLQHLEISNIPRTSLGRWSRRNTRTTVSKILVIWTSFRWAIVNPKDRNLTRERSKSSVVFLLKFFFYKRSY